MKLYNTPTKTVEEIKPANASALSIYTCGPTVYDYPHIGNWFTFIRYDLLVRALKASGHKTRWVMNITDVGHLVSDADEGEDKLEKGARREGKTAWEIANFYTDNFLKGLEKLQFSKVDVLPKATDHITEQIELVETLEKKGFTYVIDDGVYFDTAKFPAYADFAHLNLKDQEAGARVAVNPQKRQSTDFALWKLSPKGQKRDMEWGSPWGKGFPGWHLECSAMSMKYLGETLDVHAGGIDHIQVHHTNEIAQSEAATDKPFVRHWMHANHIFVDGKKISKSLNNLVTLEDVVSRGIDVMAIRMLAIESHYRSQAHFSWENLKSAETRLKQWRNVAALRWQTISGEGTLNPDWNSVLSHLENDLNTPKAISEIHQILEEFEVNLVHDNEKAAFESFLDHIDQALGLDLSEQTGIDDKLKQLLQKRTAAREQQDWPAADKYRAELAMQSIGVRDTSAGQVWYRL